MLDQVVVTIAGATFTALAKSVQIPVEANTLDTTNFGSSGWETNIAGLKRFDVEVELMQSFASGSVDAVLFSKVGTSVTFDIRPFTGTVTATNPKFTGSAILTKYAPIGGGVGDLHMVSVGLKGTGAVTRATS
jgi:predicted secreted protein